VGTRAFAFLDTTLVVESKDEPTLEWLDEVLRPWFESPSGSCEVVVTVRHARHTDGSPPGSLGPAEVLPLLLLDSKVIRLPAVRQGSRVVLDDAEEGCRYTVDGLDVSVEAMGNPGRLVLMRVIREIAVEHERRHARSLELHAAALELDGEAIALVGPKSSGKTTLLLHALTRHPARLIANDRVLADCWTGRPRVTGTPAVIRVHPRTAAAFPTLASSVPRTGDLAEMTLAEAGQAIDVLGPEQTGAELRLSAAQLARALPTSLRAAAPLRAFVFPEIGAGGDAPQLSRLAPGDALGRLRTSVYGDHGHEDVTSVFTELAARACPRARIGRTVREAKAGLVARLAADLPCFLLRPGLHLGPAIDLLLRQVRA
jgi:hypothetical protein